MSLNKTPKFSVCHHGFTFMDKQLLLTAMCLTQCRFMPYMLLIKV